MVIGKKRWLPRWASVYQLFNAVSEEQQGFTPKAMAISPEQQCIQALEKQVKQLQNDNQLLPRCPWVKKGVRPRCYGNEQRQQIAVKLKKAGNNVQQICRCLSLAPSTFYYRAKPKLIDATKVKFDAAIKQVHHDMDATYGKRRMLVEL